MNNLLNSFNIKEKIHNLVTEQDKKLAKIFEELEEKSFLNNLKVLTAFHEEGVCESDFISSTGYGYGAAPPHW